MPEPVDPQHLLLIGAGPGVGAGVDFDRDNIADLFLAAHTDSKDAWRTEYRFTGA